MIAPPTAPRPAELCASASANGIVVASIRKNNNDRIRCIGHSSKRSISHGCAPHSSQDKNEIRHNALLSFSTSCEAAGSLLFGRLLNATTMSLQSTLLSVRWSTMDVSL
jgi:hypothetical protein